MGVTSTPFKNSGKSMMSDITEIQQAILKLPESDLAQLRHWFNELDWAEWDQKIDADSDKGKLNFLIAAAKEAKEQGNLEEL